jgi:heme exporter protein B
MRRRRVIDRIRAALVIATKDIRVELASKTAITAAVSFGILVLVVFNFARDPAVVTLDILAPSVLWVTAAFAGVVTLNRSFAMEQEADAIEGLLLAPVSRSAIFLGKYLANLVFVLVVDVVVLPVFVLFFNVTPTVGLAWVALLLGLAAVGYVAIGTVLAAMTVRTRFAELMLPVLLLSFVVPPVLVGVQATTRLLAGRPISEILGWFWFLVVYDFVFLVLGLMLFPATVDQ